MAATDFLSRISRSYSTSSAPVGQSYSTRVAGPFGLQLGYRHAVIEFEDTVNGVPESTEISLSGPYLGFVFRF